MPGPSKRSVQPNNRKQVHEVHEHVDGSNGLEEPETTLYQMAAIIESSYDAIISKDLDGIITSWNAAAEHIYGYTAEEAVGRSISLIIPPERKDELPGILEQLRQGKRVEHYETERIRKDGRRINIAVTISPIRDRSGRVIGASGIGRDITEQKQIEERLRRQAEDIRAERERLASLINNIDIALVMMDKQGRIL